MQSIEDKIKELTDITPKPRILTEITVSEATYIVLIMEVAAKIWPNAIKSVIYLKLKELLK